MFHDPTSLNLRKAARAAIVMPGVFAIAQYGFDDPEAALFAAFAAFSALAMADFGGSRRRRLVPYVMLGLIGAALVALGTVVSRSAVIAAAVMVVVAFVIVLAGALGSYWDIGGKAAILAFVLAATIEAPNSQLGAREIGWALGAGAAAIAAVLLWPGEERHPVHRAAAAVASAAATVLTNVAQLGDAPEQSLTDALGTLDDASSALDDLAGVSFRPIGTTRADRGLKLLVIDVRRIAPLARHVADVEHRATPDDAALIAETARVLGVTANAIGSTSPAEIDTDALVQAREDHRDALDAAATTELARGDSAAVMTRVATAFAIRRLSLLAIALARNTEVATGSPPRTMTGDDAVHSLTIDEPGVRSATTRTGRELGAHLHPRSVRFRNAVRGAVGLAGAVLLAKALNVEHGFWVVLGTLTVLRSNAIGTRRTAVQALLGTLLGFALASALIGVVAGDTTGLWIAFPVLAFLSAYTPAAVNFVVGQASFTVLVVVLFNLVVPEGWRTGLVRLQDIAAGAAISVIVGFVLWPRGAEGVANETFAELLDTDAERLSDALDHVAGTAAADPTNAVAASWAARDRALEALEQLAAERGVDQPGAQPWASFLNLSRSAEQTADGVTRDAATGPTASACPGLREVIVTEGRRLEAELEARAELARTARPTAVSVPADDTQRAAPVDPRLSDALARCGAEAGHTPVQLLWAREWLEHLDRVLERTRVPSAGEQVSH